MNDESGVCSNRMEGGMEEWTDIPLSPYLNTQNGNEKYQVDNTPDEEVKITF